MFLPQTRSRLPWLHRRKRTSQDGSCQSRRPYRLAQTYLSKGDALLPRFRKLLQRIHRQLLSPSVSITWTYKEECSMALDWQRTERFWRSQSHVYIISHPQEPRSWQTLHSRHRCISICSWCNSQPRFPRWPTSNRVLFQIPPSSRA